MIHQLPRRILGKELAKPKTQTRLGLGLSLGFRVEGFGLGSLGAEGFGELPRAPFKLRQLCRRPAAG